MLVSFAPVTRGGWFAGTTAVAADALLCKGIKMHKTLICGLCVVAIAGWWITADGTAMAAEAAEDPPPSSEAHGEGGDSHGESDGASHAHVGHKGVTEDVSSF